MREDWDASLSPLPLIRYSSSLKHIETHRLAGAVQHASQRVLSHRCSCFPQRDEVCRAKRLKRNSNGWVVWLLLLLCAHAWD